MKPESVITADADLDVGEKFRVLVLDDEPQIRTMFKKILDNEGLKVETADSVKSALRVDDRESVDVILADENLGQVSFLKNYEAIREYFPDAAIVMISGAATSDMIIQALRTGVADFLLKPINGSALVRAVTNAARINIHRIARRLAEENIVQQNIALQSIFDTINTMIFVTDGKLQTHFVNTFACTTLQADREDLIGNDMLTKLYRDTQYAENTRDIFATLFDDLVNDLTYKTHVTDAAGNPFTINWSVQWLGKNASADRLVHVGLVDRERDLLHKRVNTLLGEINAKNMNLRRINEKNERLNGLIRQYTPKATWQSALETIDKGEVVIPNVERNFAFLFTDIAGFTSYAENRSADEVLQRLNSMFSICTNVIFAQDGDIDKFIGDAIFAIFPDALSAVRAAAQIQFCMKNLNHECVARGEPEIRIRIGISYGDAIRGNVGGSERKENTLIGAKVNVAKRLESMCRPGQILICEDTYREVAGSVRCGDPQKIQLKGFEQPMGAYEVKSVSVGKSTGENHEK